MNKIFQWTMLIPLLLGMACGSDKAAELLETAQFEERQNNRAHAKELYEEILRNYPDSPAAPTARARLTQLTEKP
jgi:TolA-binding protein